MIFETIFFISIYKNDALINIPKIIFFPEPRATFIFVNNFQTVQLSCVSRN